jgi:hypothetical protein
MGIDKLVALSSSVGDVFHNFARERGEQKWGYGHVLDLRHTYYKLPITLYCDGRHDGRHKLEVIGVSRLGQSRTLKILKEVVGHLSNVRIYRIDFCVDLLGISVQDLAAACFVRQVQNYRIFRKRGAVSFYLQCSADRTVLLYDKKREMAAKGNPLVKMLRENDELTRVEVQLKGAAVPYKKIRHLHRYADVDLLAGLEFRWLRAISADAKPLQSLAVSYLRDQTEQFGLQAVKKRFGSSEWSYIERIFSENVRPDRIPDIRLRLKKSVEDWLENRIRFPRFPRQTDP